MEQRGEYKDGLKVCSGCGILENIEKPFRYHQCRKCINTQDCKYVKRCPWAKTLKAISSRCTYKNAVYKRKGITYDINTKELKELWFRDKGWLLSRPSIDRIDKDKGYTKDNCRYMELGENIARGERPPFGWAKKFNACIECGSDKNRHVGNGFCSECYGKWRWRTYHK